jgi:hypothetical protein
LNKVEIRFRQFAKIALSGRHGIGTFRPGPIPATARSERMVVEANSKVKCKSNSSATSKNDVSKGQMSIASFFSKKTTTVADVETPRQSEKSPAKASPSPGSCDTVHKKNLQPTFEDARCLDPVANVEAKTADNKTSGNPTIEISEEDCIVVGDSKPTDKSSHLKPPDTDMKKQPGSMSIVARDSKTKKFPSSNTTQQNTLRFVSSTNVDAAKVPSKHKTSRPPHPEGLVLSFESDVLMVSEFSAKFRLKNSDQVVSHSVE